MGIKTEDINTDISDSLTLKNLPTTWGLRRGTNTMLALLDIRSEKPPHHMGIKTPNSLGNSYPQ